MVLTLAFGDDVESQLIAASKCMHWTGGVNVVLLKKKAQTS